MMKKRLISLLLCLCMAVSVLSVTVLAAATVTSDTEWTNGTDLAQSGGVVLSGGTEAAPLTVTVSGTVTVNANILVRSGHVRITGGGALLRGSGYTGAMISVSNGASLTLDHVTVSGNNVPASSCGIVVAAGGKLTINEGSVLKEHKKSNNYSKGSVLHVSGTVVMNGGTIEGNIGYNYGNIYLANGASFTMNGGTICSNSLSHPDGTYGGGVFYVRGATLTINSGTIFNHKDIHSYGGSIYCSSYGKVYLNGGAIIESSVASGKKGDSIFYSSLEDSTAELYIGGNPYISDSIYLDYSTEIKYPYITSAIKNPLTLEMSAGAEGRVIAVGTGSYQLTTEDLAKVTLRSRDGETWYAKLVGNQLVMTKTNPGYTQKYYISFLSNGGTGSTLDDTAYDPNAKASAKPNGFFRSEYTFIGWNTMPDGSGTAYNVGDEITITDKDVVLYAQWEYTPNSFSIHWDTDGDGQIDDTTTVAKGDMPEHADGSKTDANYDYTFTGWSPALTPATCETTYTAQFTAKPKTETTECTVTWYDEDGATVLTSTTCAVGSVPAAPDIVPVKASDETYSYTFKEWIAVSGVDADGKLTGDAAFKAAYTATELSAEDDDDTDLNGILAAILAGRDWFVDVYARDYYYSAVKWASEYGIASGVDKLHFAPKDPTTRAQLVTFLWRAAGCPEPFAPTCAFTDVVMGSYYEKAVLWAIENGIAKGTSDTTFSPDAYVTRGQAVAFLARMNGVADDAAGYTHSFTDVSTADYYSNAVAWAVGSGITTGTTASTFSPEAICQRCQIVTFLYRNYRY